MIVKKQNIKVMELENEDYKLGEFPHDLKSFYIESKNSPHIDSAVFNKKDLKSLIRILQRYEKELEEDKK